MDWNAPDMSSWPAKLVIRMSNKFRTNKSFTQEAINRNNERAMAKRDQLRLQHAKQHNYIARRSDDTTASAQNDVNELGERDYSIFSEATTLADSAHRDHGDMMHSLAHHDSFDSLVDQILIRKSLAVEDLADTKIVLHRVSTRQEALINRLPPDIWKRIASHLTHLEAAFLTISTRTLYEKLKSEPLITLNRPENKNDKTQFLLDMDRKLPRHLFCFACSTYHLRLNPGKETLKANINANPLVRCPNARNTYLPRLRLTHGRELPYGFVQLALRQSISSIHGMHHDQLARRWKCTDSTWSHRTRYMVFSGRLLMRVISTIFAPPASTSTATTERHLLYDREEYTPFFSVCTHWRDGDLMKLCKCALSHVPAPPASYAQQLRHSPTISRSLARPNFLVRGCDWCRPARRCPECPTEYLVEIQMVEDTAKNAPTPFRHAIVVTRWSDLGDGTSPFTSPEWTAITGQTGTDAIEHGDKGEGEYASFSHVGRRAVSGIFESHISGSIPGERMLSLNPKNKKLGEEGHGWY
ncbi:Hypothetical protein R9X50_00154900 [Acrodontium crateriforme]|uniref:F-box domain-containing protein n=1 Tax=Acrodontium crateriforme TaxID=150365 RepID=A0AAQ3R7Z2_9PEZI|nr:Hypothetical protein R9X50_00154900 [Acrodontium crateriforme]